MDTELLVDRPIDDGTNLIVQLVRDGFDVAVALWLKTREDGLWFLYIGSDSIPRGITNAGNMVQIELLDTSGASRIIPLDQVASIQ